MPTTVRRLIEVAAESLGSDVRLAERLGVSRQRVWEWKDGRRPIPMARVEHIAILAGVNPEHAIALVAVERHQLGKRIAGLAITALAAFVSVPQNANAALREALHPIHYAQCLRRLRVLLRVAQSLNWQLELRG